MSGAGGEDPGPAESSFGRAKPANPSPLTLPRPTPPLATLFSHHASLETIFLCEKKKKKRQGNVKLRRKDKIGLGVTTVWETRQVARCLLSAFVSFKPPMLSSGGFHSVALVSVPTSPVFLPPFVPSCPLPSLPHVLPRGFPKLLWWTNHIGTQAKPCLN